MKQLFFAFLLLMAVPSCFGQIVGNDTINTDQKHCITAGILEGGGAAVGFDVEQMILKPVSAQIGAGFFGDAVDVGLNVHLTKSIDGSFLSFQYCLQHYENNPKRCIIGASFVYRGFKIMTCQLGYGRAIHSSFFGCSLPDGNPNMLIFAVGVYSPF
jgi:hypothetical protein